MNKDNCVVDLGSELLFDVYFCEKPKNLHNLCGYPIVNRDKNVIDLGSKLLLDVYFWDKLKIICFITLL